MNAHLLNSTSCVAAQQRLQCTHLTLIATYGRLSPASSAPSILSSDSPASASAPKLLPLLLLLSVPRVHAVLLLALAMPALLLVVTEALLELLSLLLVAFMGMLV